MLNAVEVDGARRVFERVYLFTNETYENPLNLSNNTIDERELANYESVKKSPDTSPRQAKKMEERVKRVRLTRERIRRARCKVFFFWCAPITKRGELSSRVTSFSPSKFRRCKSDRKLTRTVRNKTARFTFETAGIKSDRIYEWPNHISVIRNEEGNKNVRPKLTTTTTTSSATSGGAPTTFLL